LSRKPSSTSSAWSTGSAPTTPRAAPPYHYVLGPLGAAVLAARQELDPARLGYRRDRALALAHSQRLAHLVGVNGFFCALHRAARRHPDADLELWWSEQTCAARWGQLVRPDGYGRWREYQARVDFFLEYDRGSEPTQRLAGNLHGYLDLAAASGIATPVLLWLPTPRPGGRRPRRTGRRQPSGRDRQPPPRPHPGRAAVAAAAHKRPTALARAAGRRMVTTRPANPRGPPHHGRPSANAHLLRMPTPPAT
jgi:Replication-relaxation